MKTYIPGRAGAVLAVPFLAVLFTALPCQAQALDTGAYLDAVDEISTVMSLADQCPLAGYTVSPQFVELVVRPVIAQAVEGGMAEEVAKDMMQTAYRTARMDEKLVELDYKVAFKHAARANDEAGTQKAPKAWFTYLDGKCATFAKMPRFSSVITAPEESGFAIFSVVMMKDLEEE